jgi:L-threonylcarbamoyladenylate synthase
VGADVFNSRAVERVYEVKKRPHHSPLPLVLANKEQVPVVASAIPPVAMVLMEHFWPGGLTLLLPSLPSVPAIVTAGTGRIAVRVPDLAIPNILVSRLGVPVIGTSANISTQPSALTAEEVEAQLGDTVDLIIDGGRCPGGIESTIVDVTVDEPVIVRHGAIPDAEIMEVLNIYKEGHP